MDWKKCLSEPDNPNSVATLQCIPILFKNVLDAAFLFVGLVAIVFVIFSGYKFITSRGDAKQIEGAKNTLTYAVIGLLVVLFSVLIVNVIAFVTGVDCVSLQIIGFDTCK